jgi:hypothetical protein
VRASLASALRRTEIVTPIVSWAAGRAAVGVALVVAVVVSDELVPGARPPQVDEGLLAWDGTWYENIAANGYGDEVAREGLRFFPLVPMLARAVDVAAPGDAGVALLIVANAAALVLAFLVHRLAVHETGDTGLADRATWLVAVVPPAYVLAMGYAESTLMALSVAAFLALRRKRWWWAAAFGVLAGLTRPVGLALAVPAAVEGARGLRAAGGRERAGRLAAVVSPVVGTGIYLAWVEARFGDWLLPLRLHSNEDLRGDVVDPLTRLGRAAGDLFGGDPLGAGLHFPWVVGTLVLVVVAARVLPSSYAAFAAAVVAVALAGESLGSFERYALSAFPLVLALAVVTRPPPVERAVLALSGAGLIGFASLAFLGAYVP